MENNFASNSSLFTSVINLYLSEGAADKKQISKSIFARSPYAIPYDPDNLDGVEIQEFLDMLDKRLAKEKAYADEIMKLKDMVCNEYETLSSGVIDQLLLYFIRNQRQMVVDKIIDSTKIDKIQIITQFFNNVMNGLTEEALKEMENIIFTIFCKGMPTPIPLGLIDLLKDSFEEIKNQVTQQNLEEKTVSILEYIENHMKPIEINTCDFETSSQFAARLKQLEMKRKVCIINADFLNDYSEQIEEYKEKCIKSVSVSLDASDFIYREFNYRYKTLVLKTNINNISDMQTFFDKIPKRLRVMQIGFDDIANEDLQVLNTEISKLTSLKGAILDFSNQNDNELKDDEVLSISCAIATNKSLVEIDLNFTDRSITSNGLCSLADNLKKLPKLEKVSLSFENSTAIDSNGIIGLSDYLSNAKLLKNLYLNFTECSINNEGLTKLSDSIQNMQEIVLLHLLFGGENNSAEDSAIISLSTALKSMKKLEDLALRYWGEKHSISKEAIITLFKALFDLDKITELSMSFGEGKNELQDDAIEELAASLKNMKKFNHLELESKNGQGSITDQGMNSLAAALSELNLLTVLSFEFGGGKNGITDASFENLCNAILQKNKLVTLELYLWGELFSITNQGMKALANAIDGLQDLTQLKLDFQSGNSITKNGMKMLATVICKKTNITELMLNFNGGSYEVLDAEFKLFTAAIENMTGLKYLFLAFGGGSNKITDISMKNLAEALLTTIHIETIELYLWEGKNSITDKGLAFLAESFKYLEELSSLQLDFSDGEHAISNEGLKALSAGIVDIPASLKLTLTIKGGSNTITQEGIDELENAREYGSFTFESKEEDEEEEANNADEQIQEYYRLPKLTL